ncbi:MAG: EFR1 family ferrodoxin [Candidatus Heimdallarchaeota archaeon]
MISNVVMFYFSGTGNTWWVGKQIEKILTEKGVKVKNISFEAEKFPDDKAIEKLVAEADTVGFGYPIYGSDIPPNFMKFIDDFPKVDKKSAFVFTTMMLFSGDGAVVGKRRLRRRGFKVKQAINIRMPNNVKLPYPIFKWFPIKNDDENNTVKEKAIKKATKLVNRILAEKKWVQGWDPINIAGGLMQRVEMRLFDLSVYARNYFVDEETCTECMQCVDYCPTENITFDDGKFVWGKKCALCLRCYNLCPEDAIQYKKATLKREKYTRYKGPGNGFQVTEFKK